MRPRHVVITAVAIGLSLSAAAGAAATEDTTASSSSSPAAAAAGPGDFGTLKDVCGPGDAKGSTDQGVSDDEIVVGTMSDPGNVIVPGLNQELFDAADAFVGWCNAAGGIKGRQIVLNKRDAKLTEAAPQMVAACQTDFMLIGAGVVFDDAANVPRLECGLSEIAGYAVSQTAGNSDNLLIGMATSDQRSLQAPIFKAILAADPSVKDFFGVWNLGTPSVIPAGLREMEGGIRNGMKVVAYEEIPTSVDNWRPFVEKLKEANVQVLTMANTPEQLVGAMRAMNDAGYFPKYIVLSTNFYNDKLIEEGGDLLDKTHVIIFGGFPLFQMADQYPAMKRYLDNLNTYAGGKSPKALGVNATSAWLAFAVAAGQCGSDLTRACVMANAAKLTAWDAGGLHPARPLTNLSGPGPECFFAIRASASGFDVDPIVTPTDGLYHCAADNFTLVV